MLKVDFRRRRCAIRRMVFAIPFPSIDPEIFSIDIGPISFALRWYALAYIVGILIGWGLARLVVRRPALWRDDTPSMTGEQLEALMTWIILGIILGGRLGYVLFYQPGYYFENPGEILAIWQGGMAFHGGLLGVIVATVVFCWVNRLRLIGVADVLALGTPAGIMLGRIANFINGELWGKPTNAAIGVIFPDPRAQVCPPEFGMPCARHASQLYEAGLEGLLLGLLLLWLVFARKALKRPGTVAGVFFLGYGLARFFVEYFREADGQFMTAENPMGYIVQLGPLGLQMGQLLSLPMIAAGLLFLLAARRAR